MGAPAADDLDGAVGAAAAVAGGVDTERVRVLHHSNNVVVRVGHLVFKVTTDRDRAGLDVAVASHVFERRGPALAPVDGPIEHGRFFVTVWPYVEESAGSGDVVHAALALRRLHASLKDLPIPLRPLTSRLEDVSRLLRDNDATNALSFEGRASLLQAVAMVIPATAGTAVLHTEPHDRNRLQSAAGTLYIDFEDATVGPVEWDLAYFDGTVAERVWPEHDPARRALLNLGVSACVSAACWRHVTVRPSDSEMRWHAQHHLDLVKGHLL